MNADDADVIRRIGIKLSRLTNTGLDYLFQLSLYEFKKLIKAVSDEM